MVRTVAILKYQIPSRKNKRFFTIFGTRVALGHTLFSEHVSENAFLLYNLTHSSLK